MRNGWTCDKSAWISFVCAVLLQLELPGIGIGRGRYRKLKMHKSKHLSLLTEENFRKWAMSNANVLDPVTTAEDLSETDTIVPSSNKVDDTDN